MRNRLSVHVSSRRLLVGEVSVALVVFVVAAVLLSRPNPAAANPGPTPTATPHCMPPCVVQPDQVDNLPPSKRDAYERGQTRIAELQQTPYVPKPTPVPVPTAPPLNWPGAIWEGTQPTSGYIATNMWGSPDSSTQLSVQAGAPTNPSLGNPPYGLVMVNEPHAQHRYVTTDAIGELRIVAAHGDVLTLFSQLGIVLGFDVTSRTFVPATLPEWGSGIETKPTEMDFPAGVPFGRTEYKIMNIWQSSLGDRYVRVFAGESGSAPGHGYLIVQKVGPGLWPDKTWSADRLQAPGTPGALRIVDAAGGVLTISSDSGARFSFDIATEQFTEIP